MAMFRNGAATVVETHVDPKKWIGSLSSCKGDAIKRARQIKVAKSVVAKYSPEKYLLSHCTIIAAVDTDLADSKNPKSDWLIKPDYSKFVNNNGDAWTKKVLASTYKTFVGAQNYQEHIQVPELSKGRVIDAVLRQIPIGKDKEGNDQTTYYVDILVATDRKHKDLVRKIEAKELNTLSMGCTIAYSICSKCGNKAVDETDACTHVRYQKGNTFYDDNGIQRVIAELCGSKDDVDSVKFIEASWVKNPAFTGAVIRNVIDLPEEVKAKIEDAHKVESYQVTEFDFLKAASEVVAQEDEAGPEDAPSEDTPEPGPEEEAPEEEAPADDAPEPLVDDEAPAEEAPAELPEEPAEEEGVGPWKKNVKKQIMDELAKEITDEFSDKSEDSRTQELETLDDTIIKPAHTLKEVWKAKKGWENYLKRTAGNLPKEQFEKLRFGTYTILNEGDLTRLSKHGYSKRDFLAVLSYMDNLYKKPLAAPIKKVIAKLNGTNGLQPEEMLRQIVASIGRKLTKKEATRAIMWLKLLDHYED